jgi:hypothetical protein
MLFWPTLLPSPLLTSLYSSPLLLLLLLSSTTTTTSTTPLLSSPILLLLLLLSSPLLSSPLLLLLLLSSPILLLLLLSSPLLVLLLLFSPLLYVWQAVGAIFFWAGSDYSMFGSSCSIFFWQALVAFFWPTLRSSVFAYDEIVQLHTLCGIWANDQEPVRNLTSIPIAPTLPIMLSLCSKFMIKWWLTCFWGLYLYSFCDLLLLYQINLWFDGVVRQYDSQVVSLGFLFFPPLLLMNVMLVYDLT